MRCSIFEEPLPFSGFSQGSQQTSVSPLLLALVSMILDGPSFKDQMTDTTTAALTIAQMLKFNSVKHKRKQSTSASSTVRHRPAQETPVPMYVGMMLHAQTCKRELVDRLSQLGISISYDRVLHLTTQMGNSIGQQFRLEQVVCPPKMRGAVFTTAGIDNIDHNPSATTAKFSFHGTAIIFIQHLSFCGEGVDSTIVFTGGSGDGSSTLIRQLPQCYTDIPLIISSIKNMSLPAARVTSPAREVKPRKEEEYLCLQRQVLDGNNGAEDNISWTAFHASRQPPETQPIYPTSLFLMFQESAHTLAMI